MDISRQNFKEKETLDAIESALSACELCPRRCGVNRLAGETGPCGAGARARLASATIHRGEEPPISGTEGSATFFFSHCPLSCRFCQNYPISQLGNGRDQTIVELSEKMLTLASKGAHNINIVTGTQFAPHVVAAVAMAREQGLSIPIVWNTSGYENEETISLLDGTVDIYLTDIKYTDEGTARRLSSAKGYFPIAVAAAKKMIDQVGTLTVDEKGIAKKGVIIRHLVLPFELADTRGVMKTIAREFGDKVPISLMGQYFPANRALNTPNLTRPITPEEYEEAQRSVMDAGIDWGWFQEMENPDLKRGA